MKKGIVIALLLAAAVLMAFPQPSYAWDHGGGHRGGYGFGWYGPGVFIGGALLGALIASSWYAYPPPRTYVYPAPVYVYPVPGPAYAYPPQPEAYASPTCQGLSVAQVFRARLPQENG